MHIVFSFLMLHMAQLWIACGEFGCLSEGNYLCDSCSGWTETMSICGPFRKSGGHKALPGNFEYFLLWLDVILSVHVEWMCSHVLEIKIQTWARPQLSAFQRQPGSGARQACRHIISAQCRECSDGVDAYHVSVMLKIWRECAHAQQTTKQQQTANKQQHTEI